MIHVRIAGGGVVSLGADGLVTSGDAPTRLHCPRQETLEAEHFPSFILDA